MMIWIFVGVVVATTMFLMVMVYKRPGTTTTTVARTEMEMGKLTETEKITYQNNRDELRAQFLTVNALNTEDSPLKLKVIDTQDSLDEKLWSLAQQLREKERMMQTTVAKIQEAESKLSMETPRDETLERVNRKIIEELKMELQLTELECKNLQEQIRVISARREALAKEVTKEQIRVISARREALAKEVTKQQHIFNTTMNSLVTDLHFMREETSDAGKAMGSDNRALEKTDDHKSKGMLFGNDAKLLPFKD